MAELCEKQMKQNKRHVKGTKLLYITHKAPRINKLDDDPEC